MMHGPWSIGMELNLFFFSDFFSSSFDVNAETKLIVTGYRTNDKSLWIINMLKAYHDTVSKYHEYHIHFLVSLKNCWPDWCETGNYKTWYFRHDVQFMAESYVDHLYIYTQSQKNCNIFEVAFLLEKSVYQWIWGHTSFRQCSR